MRILTLCSSEAYYAKRIIIMPLILLKPMSATVTCVTKTLHVCVHGHTYSHLANVINTFISTYNGLRSPKRAAVYCSMGDGKLLHLFTVTVYTILKVWEPHLQCAHLYLLMC